MLLVLDIGNTNTVLGLYNISSPARPLVGKWRISSLDRTVDETGLLLKSLLQLHDARADGIRGVVLSSVVPRLEETWSLALKTYIDAPTYVVTNDADLGIGIDTDNPAEVGADRLVNSVAAVEKYGCPLITVDLGTAITLDVVSKERNYIGGAIAPGLSVSVETLFSRTARLPQIPLTAPERAIGRNTKHAIQSGIVYGYAGLLDALVERIWGELGVKTKVVATGGHAEIIAGNSRTITDIEPWLTLDGLLILYYRLSGQTRGK